MRRFLRLSRNYDVDKDTFRDGESEVFSTRKAITRSDYYLSEGLLYGYHNSAAVLVSVAGNFEIWNTVVFAKECFEYNRITEIFCGFYLS